MTFINQAGLTVSCTLEEYAALFPVKKTRKSTAGTAMAGTVSAVLVKKTSTFDVNTAAFKCSAAEYDKTFGPFKPNAENFKGMFEELRKFFDAAGIDGRTSDAMATAVVTAGRNAKDGTVYGTENVKKAYSLLTGNNG